MTLEWIYENKELLKTLYALLLMFLCAIIVLKTDRLFKLSDHQGLRYFRNYFFFCGIAFVFRFLISSSLKSYNFLAIILYEFFILVASFSLFYSLTWKTLGPKKNHHSLLNFRMAIFYVVSLSMALLDWIYNTSLILSFSQIIIFLVMLFISYKNYSTNGKDYFFLRLYLFAMLISLVLWIFTFYFSLYGQNNSAAQIIFYGINLLFFLIFFGGTMRVTQNG